MCQFFQLKQHYFLIESIISSTIINGSYNVGVVELALHFHKIVLSCPNILCYHSMFCERLPQTPAYHAYTRYTWYTLRIIKNILLQFIINLIAGAKHFCIEYHSFPKFLITPCDGVSYHTRDINLILV